MEVTGKLEPKSDSELEAWFEAGLMAEAIQVDHMLGVLESVSKTDAALADSWSDLLQESLGERGEGRALVRVLSTRARWQTDPEAFRRGAAGAVASGLDDRLGKAFVKACGFDKKLPVLQCLERLDLLLRLGPGILCFDRTWGFGVVRRVDELYEKVEIDFDGKQGHQMSFAYAAETLELIDDSHLLARRHRDPEELRRMVAEEPAEVVRVALRSYGPLSAPLLKEALVDAVFPEADWKVFWDAARKELKTDPLVDLPARRNDPLRLRSRAKEYDSAWFAALRQDSDPVHILALLSELAASNALGGIGEDAWDAVTNRIAFVVKAAEGRDPAMLALCLLRLESLGIAEERFPRGPLAMQLLHADPMAGATAGLPARDVGRFFRAMDARDGERTAVVVLEALPHFESSVLAEAISFLGAGGRQDACAARLRELLGGGAAGVSVLQWLCRNLETVQEWQVCRLSDLLMQSVDGLETRLMGDGHKAQNQIRELFARKEWLTQTLAALSDGERITLLTKIRTSRGWDTSGRRSVMAHMIRLYPSLERVVADRAAEDQGGGGPGRYTSWRAFRERQAQLKELVQRTIPENSREIAHARSYGDLRENFEYQAAKDRQRLLLQRRAELERDLQEVQGSHFSGFRTDVAGMGTSVHVKTQGGDVASYCIMGEWDRDEALGIVSSQSQVALALEGSRVGDTVTLPTVDGSETVTVVEVSGLSEDAKAWAAG